MHSEVARFSRLAALAVLTVATTAALPADAQRRARSYEVSVTNVTRNQQFTPLLVVSHDPEIRLFQAGSPASPELETLAEEGDVAPLATLLESLDGVRRVETTEGLLDPGQTAVLTIRARRPEVVSLAAMAIPTNDAFVALNGIELPRSFDVLRTTALAYDAGTERNDELCASIPGPDFEECGGPGGGAAPEGDEEGYVHVHPGIHGIGDLDESERDWRNPVGIVTIRRVR